MPEGILPCDGQPIQVRRLRFLELNDRVSFDDPGPYIHAYAAGNRILEEPYTLADFENEDVRPPEITEAEAKERGDETALDQWERWHLFKAVVRQAEVQSEYMVEYVKRCARYILANCIDPEDRQRVVTPAGYRLIYELGVPLEAREEDFEAELASTFPGFMAW